MQSRLFPVVALVVSLVAAAVIPMEAGRQYRTSTEAAKGSFVVSALPASRYTVGARFERAGGECD